MIKPDSANGQDKRNQRNLTSIVASRDGRILGQMVEALLGLGWTVSEATSAREAFSRIDGKDAELLVLDLDLPDTPSMDAISRFMENMREVQALLVYSDGNILKELNGFQPPNVVNIDKDAEAFEENSAVSLVSITEAIRRKHGIPLDMPHESSNGNKKLAGFFETVTQAAKVVSSAATSLDEKLRRCLELALKQLGAERGSIMLTDEDGGALVVRVSTVSDIIGVKQSLKDDHMASLAVRERRLLTSADPTVEKRATSQGERKYKGENFLSCPVTFQDDVVGVINVTDKTSPGGFSEDDLAALTTFAAIVSNAVMAFRVQKERDELKRLQQLKENMTSMIVHDLKGPCGDIMANLNMLESYISDDFGRETLSVAVNSTEELMEMVMDILDINRMEEGRFTINPLKTDVVELARRKTEKMEPLVRAEDKTVTFESERDSLEVMVDPDILARVIWNLLSNANNHTGPGCAIAVSVRKKEGGALISVSDNGTGIPEEDIEIIFDKFAQASSGEKRAKYSSGLGLAFCKMAVEAQNGVISVESSPGKGATFHIFLP